MPTLSNYVFNSMTGITDDNCNLTQRNTQNVNSASYPVTNYFENDVSMKGSMDLALSHPNINYNGSHQVGTKGFNIDNSSKLLIGTTQTNPKCRIDIQERPYKTVPFLGRGRGDIDIEAKLQQGDQITNKKSVSTVTETSHIPLRHTPMIEKLQHAVTNPANLIENEADKNWVRGGSHTRNLYKKTN